MSEKKSRSDDKVYAYWRACHKMTPDEAQAYALRTMYDTDTTENPQCGLWKVTLGGGYKDGVKQPKITVPMQVWLAEPNDPQRTAVKEWRPGLVLVGLLDLDEPIGDRRIVNLWLGAGFLSIKERDAYRNAGKKWPWDVPDLPSQNTPAPAADQPVGARAPISGADTPGGSTAGAATESSSRGPGDNSGDLAGFRAMRDELLNEVSEASTYFRDPIATLDQAHKCENWAGKIIRLKNTFAAAKKVEKDPLYMQLDEIERRYAVVIEQAESCVKALKAKGDAFASAENERRRKAAEAEALAKLAADTARREAERQAALERNAEIEREREEMETSDPIAAMTGSLPEFVDVPAAPEAMPTAVPVVHVEPVQIGTSRKRTAGKKKAEPGAAVITDLGLAAAYLAEQNDPDLIALVQKRADKAAAAGVAYPGCRLPGAAA